MDSYSPKLLAIGLRGMIGKGYRDDAVRATLTKCGAVHFAAIGGAGALLAKTITAARTITYEDLGPEAIYELTVKDFPAIVAYDSHGQTVYNRPE